MGTLALILVPAALFIAAVVAVLAIRSSGGARAMVPVPWLALTLVLLILGLFVAPRLLGFTFVFLPFLWIAGAGRRRRDG